MFKPARRLALVLAFAVLAVSGLTPLTTATARPVFVTTESKYAAIVVDAGTGEVLYERNPDAERYPASISKIMTLYLTFDALKSGKLKLTDRVEVSPHAASMAPSKLGIRPGESVSVDEAIRAVAVKSANDMAVALAEKVGGSESRFASLMTLKAQELGMVHTHYVNASGLPDTRQISSARDIATLSRAVMRDFPEYYSYFGIKEFAFHGESIRNHNGLLGRAPGVDGLKTGYINASGFNLAASAVRDNRRLIVVVLGGNSTAARDAHVADLLDTGFMVLRRRAAGEHIQFAQNLFEPAPIGPISRPPTEEGSADQAGVRIVLTNTRPTAAADIAEKDRAYGIAAESPRHPGGLRAERAARRELARDARRPSARSRHARAESQWAVQVSGIKGRAAARRDARALASRHGRGEAEAAIASASGGRYNARVSGLSARQAKLACREARAHGEACTLVHPSA